MAASNNCMIVFSDLDGTILSAVDYDPGPALPAVKFAISRGMDFVIVSSKTKAEIEDLQQQFGWNFGFIIENGGAIYLPKSRYKTHTLSGFIDDAEYIKFEFDSNFDEMCATLDEIGEQLNLNMIAFHNLDISELADLTGLSHNRAELMRKRQYDEPFIIAGDNQEKIRRLIEMIEEKGYRHTRGGRFHHMTIKCDKGMAVNRVIQLLKSNNRNFESAAIGDAANDLPMFQQVDFPFLVRKPDSSFVQQALHPGITITAGIGPHGFAEAIHALSEKSCI